MDPDELAALALECDREPHTDGKHHCKRGDDLHCWDEGKSGLRSCMNISLYERWGKQFGGKLYPVPGADLMLVELKALADKS